MIVQISKRFIIGGLIIAVFTSVLIGCANANPAGIGASYSVSDAPVQEALDIVPAPEPDETPAPEFESSLSDKYYKSTSANGSYLRFSDDGAFYIGSDEMDEIMIGTYALDDGTLILTANSDDYAKQFLSGQTDMELYVSSDYNEIGMAGSAVLYLRNMSTLSGTYYFIDNLGENIQFSFDNKFVYRFENGHSYNGTYQIVGDSLTLDSSGLTTSKKNLIVSSDKESLENANSEVFNKN